MWYVVMQVEAELEQLDQHKRQLRALNAKVKGLTLADKSNLYDEREHERTRKKHMDSVEKYASKHSQEVHAHAEHAADLAHALAEGLTW